MQSSLRAIPNITRIGAPRFFSTTPSGERQIKKTVIDNGVTVVSTFKNDDVLGSAGVYVNTGSAVENHENHGCSHYLRRFLYKGTNRASGLRVTRTIENITASFTANNAPEHLVYKSSFVHDHMDQVMLMMGDILRPRLSEWEFRDVRNLVQHDVNQRSTNQKDTVLDHIRHVAFGGVGLGRSPLCPAYNVNQIYPEHVAEYILGNVVGSNITVVGNVPDHDAFVTAVAHGISALPKSSPVDVDRNVSSEYFGGSRLLSSGPGSVYAEAYKGATPCTKESHAQSVLAEILGNYNSRAALPGQQNSSRLSKNLAGKVTEASTFVLNDSQTVFGVYAVGNGPCRDLASPVHQQLVALANGISKEEFDVAVNAVRSKALLASERRFDVLDGVYAYSPEFKSTFEITIADVQEVAKKMLSEKPTIFASGDLQNLPSFVR